MFLAGSVAGIRRCTDDSSTSSAAVTRPRPSARTAPANAPNDAATWGLQVLTPPVVIGADCGLTSTFRHHPGLVWPAGVKVVQYETGCQGAELFIYALMQVIFTDFVAHFDKSNVKKFI